jgi:hypothetical protein
MSDLFELLVTTTMLVHPAGATAGTWPGDYHLPGVLSGPIAWQAYEMHMKLCWSVVVDLQTHCLRTSPMYGTADCSVLSSVSPRCCCCDAVMYQIPLPLLVVLTFVHGHGDGLWGPQVFRAQQCCTLGGLQFALLAAEAPQGRLRSKRILPWEIWPYDHQ